MAIVPDDFSNLTSEFKSLVTEENGVAEYVLISFTYLLIALGKYFTMYYLLTGCFALFVFGCIIYLADFKCLLSVCSF